MDNFDIEKEYNAVKDKLDENLNEIKKDKNKFIDVLNNNKKCIVLTIISTIWFIGILTTFVG